MVLESNRQKRTCCRFFFLFCFLFLMGHKKLLKEFNMGTNINNLGCYLKLQLIRSAVERILHPISWAKLS